MSFYWRVKGEFDPGTQRQGRTCFMQGRVDVVEETPERVVAYVTGDQSDCLSVLEWKDGSLSSACSCRSLSGKRPCSHVVATILAADTKNLLLAIPKDGPVNVVSRRLAFSEIMAAGFASDEAEGDVDLVEDDEEESARRSAHPPQPPRPIEPGWAETINNLDEATRRHRSLVPRVQPGQDEVIYAFPVAAGTPETRLEIHTFSRDAIVRERPPALKPRAYRQAQIESLPQIDREILSILKGNVDSDGSWGYRGYDSARQAFTCSARLFRMLLPVLCSTGRFYLYTRDRNLIGPFALDQGPAWDLRLKVQASPAGDQWTVRGALVRGDEDLPLSTVQIILAAGIVFADGKVADVDLHGAIQWLPLCKPGSCLMVPKQEELILLRKLWGAGTAPPIDWPEPLRFAEVEITPRPMVRLRKRFLYHAVEGPLAADIGFKYGDEHVEARSALTRIADVDRRRVILRNQALEQAALSELPELGFRPLPRYVQSQTPSEKLHDLEIVAKRVPKAVRTMIEKGWHVEAEGKLYRQAGAVKMSVSSGVDWFDVNGKVDFEGQTVELPVLLKTLRRGETSIALGDGTIGMLPEDWLKRYGLLLETGKAEGDSIRFGRAQVGLLDALLAAQPEASVDEAFEKARKALRDFDGVHSATAPPSFRGELRPYQQEGLGWMRFLRQFGFGGCLADDMGLGKTVQVLALLESHRVKPAQRGKTPAPALIVVPRSLIFNWKSEAARFAPRLRVLDHSGMSRLKSLDHLSDHDMVLTTYGTLRRDVTYLKDFNFEYVILDEAQAIKNSDSESAKAARLLTARHRLALSGTPIENHLGELWSLFEFLNPGMLGGSSVLKLFAGGSGRTIDPEVLPVLQSALRPFILRRKKEQVAKDLPEKLEQTLFCELEADEKRRYDELRDHFRAKVLGLVDEEGIRKVQFHVLEALLRLRQAACHPGLINKTLEGESSAKLDILLAQIKQVWEEGHKILVFSQFTQFLAIVKRHLDREGIPYEYLDGKTRDRQARVDHFQNDPECKLFLISLKAGGLGLNLTAAEYVFLLDPWWNPAVEAQAIDRAHRIGQTQRVFAYRIVARGTVEEKVLELQRSKRELADAIINEQGSLIKGLSREDLERLLS